MKKQNFKVRKMKPYGEKYDQLTLFNGRGVRSWFDCPTGEWKKGYVHFVADHDGVSPVYKIIVGDKALDWDECWVLEREEQYWKGLFESAGFEVRYSKPHAA
jgi:hypothetical protein